MRCPYCDETISFATVCPKCGKQLHYSGNTVLFEQASRGKLTLKSILGGVFTRHKKGDVEKSLIGVTSEVNMLTDWMRPWLYVRVFAFLLVVTALLVVFINQLGYISFVSAPFIGSLVMPITLMVFIWEMDIPRNVSIWDMIVLLMIGGIFSLLFAAEINTKLDIEPFMAGFTEEPVKLLICIAFICIKRKGYYALDGLAIGAAVAAGFAFMETISYSLMFSGEYLNFDSMMETILVRSIYSLSSHIMYTAPAIGALCLVMNGSKLKLSHLYSKTFLLYFGGGVALHCANNADFNIFMIGDYISLKYIIQVIINWWMLLNIFKRGINEVLNINAVRVLTEQTGNIADPQGQHKLLCITGEYKGLVIPVFGWSPIRMGRDLEKCSLLFKSGAISSVHCSLVNTAKGLVITDEGSTNGTYVNGNKMERHVGMVLHKGDRICIGSNAERFDVQ